MLLEVPWQHLQLLVPLQARRRARRAALDESQEASGLSGNTLPPGQQEIGVRQLRAGAGKTVSRPNVSAQQRAPRLKW